MKTDKINIEDIVLMGNHPDARYALTINPYLIKKIQKHLALLSAIKLKESQSKWVLSAIREKLENEDETDATQREARINVSIDLPTLKELDNRVEIFKKFRRSFSRKQWIIEAISEKLDRDEKDVLQKLKAKMDTVKYSCN